MADRKTIEGEKARGFAFSTSEKYNLNALQPIDILNIISEKQVCSEDFSPHEFKCATADRYFKYHLRKTGL
ncbi:MAG: hypothetical protein EAZ60_25875 [Oscillatoriales cyanobacterium]|nr:hypothetical protein [Microcoleus sp. PH2017_27_LUM_O_A]TAE82440.1 MAG: hypothetical protein EAZ83_12250 [Oscillatoriales cyanobacterium]TAE95806.1 MAG: hypothetical protein EAZ79_17360 [Oscillatoriales cyanobacterium]TAF19922.1 MAG: hypothetical protein EAZ73_13705 [Oscillatoriales cyanobacterium]TAF38108.1 MAG: hypothetical protein EAZ69_05525 [Oscillatoriales cyanobacterium]